MPLPRTIVIDTNVFDQHAYHFASPTIQKFVDLTKAEKFTLLLPDPLHREIKRHISEKSKKVAAALKNVTREAPLIYRWPHWPGTKAAAKAAEDIEEATLADWDNFLKNFTAEKLGYKDIDLEKIMENYDRQQPPFGAGDKRKEFPDAFVIASVAAYSKANKTQVAVVSADPDIKKACALQPGLLYFSDLPSLTEALLDEAGKTRAIKAAVAANPTNIIACIREAFPELAFYPEEYPDGDVEDVKVQSVNLSNVRVISIEDGYCTIAFDADAEFSAYVSYDDPDSMVIDSSEDFRMALHTRAGTVTETANLFATIYLDFDEKWKAILSAYDLEFDTQTITIEARPPIRYDDDDDGGEPSQEDFVPPEPQNPQ
jgi:hypothetical protein